MPDYLLWKTCARVHDRTHARPPALLSFQNSGIIGRQSSRPVHSICCETAFTSLFNSLISSKTTHTHTYTHYLHHSLQWHNGPLKHINQTSPIPDGRHPSNESMPFPNSKGRSYCILCTTVIYTKAAILCTSYFARLPDPVLICQQAHDSPSYNLPRCSQTATSRPSDFLQKRPPELTAINKIPFDVTFFLALDHGLHETKFPALSRPL